MLLKRIRAADAASVAVIGLAKNAGKTTVLNHLVAECAAAGLSVGLVSVGVDGEKADAWTGRAKPPVRAPAGTLVAVAAYALAECRARYTVLERLKATVPFGDTLLVRLEEAGELKLAGTPTTADVRRAFARFRAHGAALCLADGAYDRMAAAAPEVSAGCVLVAGASLHPAMDEVVRRVREAVARLALPEAPPELARLAEAAGSGAAVLGRADGTVRTLGRPGEPLEAQRAALCAALRDGFRRVCLAGALTARVWGMLDDGQPLDLVVRDPTRVFLPYDALRRLHRRGVRLWVRRGVRLCAVAANPVSPDGWRFDADAFLDALAAAAWGLPVVDVVAGKERVADGGTSPVVSR